MAFSPLRLGWVRAAMLGGTLSAVFYIASLSTRSDGPPPGMSPTAATPPEPPTAESAQLAEMPEQERGLKATASLRQEVALLRDEVAQLHRQLQRYGRSLAELRRGAVGTVSLPPHAETDLDPQEASERAAAAQVEEAEKRAAEFERRSQERAELIEASLRAEAIDKTWSDQTRAAINEVLSSADLSDTSMPNVDCRSTLCRVEVTHTDPISQSEFENRLIEKTASLLPAMTMRTVANEDGTTHAVIYLAREGRSFPQPPP